ncbi:MAG: DMT family transporter, partial [Muribaculaceae bacterium]|nr:DMT family transporter [Muribaculaceae bacterium]
LTVTETPSRKYHPVTMLRWTFLFAAIPAAMLLPSLAHMPVLDTKAATPWAEAAFIMLCPSFLAYFLLSPALKRIGSELVSIYQYLIPVVATVASVAMKLDRLHWQQVVAMAVIIGGMILTTIAKKRRQKRIADTGKQTVGNQTGNQKP